MRRQKATPFNRIVPALVHIQAHLGQDLSLEFLADRVQLSKQVGRVFSR
jgi:transcriptional regulator GlxA family with amidase domain